MSGGSSLRTAKPASAGFVAIARHRTHAARQPLDAVRKSLSPGCDSEARQRYFSLNIAGSSRCRWSSL